MKTVTAIVPCYNEADRIESVLENLVKVALFSEIIVVDDGSTDDTFERVKKYPVTYLRNPKNLGKSAAMERGVEASTGEILFFCDADLKGLKPNIIETIIQPVIDEETDMSIGVRANKMQRLTKFSALLSGERALKRELWEQLPAYYKKNFRIEAGLNKYAKHYGKGFTYHLFDDYFQTLKEVKYGFIQGFKRRVLMFWDVYLAVVTFQFFHHPIRRSVVTYILNFLLSLVAVGFSVLIIIMGTRAGYMYLWSVGSELLRGTSNSSFFRSLMLSIGHLSLSGIRIVGYGLLGLGLIFLVFNMITLIRWIKAYKKTKKTLHKS
jgi:glycosyltransferase involved in cell wall biosynthesis